jgi:nitrogen regulatory protein P-II 1
MTRITCMIRPHRLEAVKSAIAALNVSGLNVSDVRGTGNSPESAAWFGGEEHVEAILEHARTGEPGDGKIFVETVVDALRIRTGERGEAAL